MKAYKALVALFALLSLAMVAQAGSADGPLNLLVWPACAALALLCYTSARLMSAQPLAAVIAMAAALGLFWFTYGLAAPALLKTGSHFGDLAWFTLGLALNLLMLASALVSAFLSRRRRKAAATGP